MKKKLKKKKKVKCEKCKKKIATKQIDHFGLTGEYSNHKPHNFCEPCFDFILFSKQTIMQMHEFASEDEQISGDYES